MYGKGLLKGLGITLKHTFEREITVQYPEQMPDLADRFRGSLVFEFEKCIVCGMCTKACPNNVLTIDSVKDEASKKKKLLSYTIDLQYCMFCNMCVETCPANCLSFNHDFELSQYKREDIKRVYHRPEGMDAISSAEGAQEASEAAGAAEDKQQKQINAMVNALQKNPQKPLAKLLENEEQAQILAELLLADEKKLQKVAQLMIEDREKAKKIAVAFVNKEIKDRNKEGDE